MMRIKKKKKGSDRDDPELASYFGLQADAVCYGAPHAHGRAIAGGFMGFTKVAAAAEAGATVHGVVPAAAAGM